MPRLTYHLDVPYIAHTDIALAFSEAGLADITETFAKGAPWRRLFATESFGVSWNEQLPRFRRTPTQSTPLAQATDELQGFCDGRIYRFGPDFHPLDPLQHDTWELKTPDVRIYGWFPVRDFFIAHSLGDANKSHGKIGYQRVTTVVREMHSFRDNLPVSIRRSVAGKKVQDVLTNRIR